MSLTVFCVNARLFLPLFLVCTSSISHCGLVCKSFAVRFANTCIFVLWEQSICVLLEYVFFSIWKGVQAVHVIHAHVYCCLWITMYSKWALEESLLADVFMALPIHKYEPWHLYFPYSGLSLARCSEDCLLGAFNYGSSWHIVYRTHKKKKTVFLTHIKQIRINAAGTLR